MSQDITIDVAGARVTLPAATLTNLWLERVRGGDSRAARCLPKIGAAFPGESGIYAGLVAGDDGDSHLLVLDGDRDNLTWSESIAWAESIGGRLPMRREQAVLFGNVPALFEKNWYWSAERYAGDDEYAWFQYFGNGGLSYYRTASRCRARAVRSIPI